MLGDLSWEFGARISVYGLGAAVLDSVFVFSGQSLCLTDLVLAV